MPSKAALFRQELAKQSEGILNHLVSLNDSYRVHWDLSVATTDSVKNSLDNFKLSVMDKFEELNAEIADLRGRLDMLGNVAGPLLDSYETREEPGDVLNEAMESIEAVRSNPSPEHESRESTEHVSYGRNSMVNEPAIVTGIGRTDQFNPLAHWEQLNLDAPTHSVPYVQQTAPSATRDRHESLNLHLGEGANTAARAENTIETYSSNQSVAGSAAPEATFLDDFECLQSVQSILVNHPEIASWLDDETAEQLELLCDKFQISFA